MYSTSFFTSAALFDSWSITVGTIINYQARSEVYAFVSVNSKLYLIGGNMAALEFFAECEMFDPSTNAWQSISSLPEPRTFFGDAVYNSEMLRLWWERNLLFSFTLITLPSSLCFVLLSSFVSSCSLFSSFPFLSPLLGGSTWQGGNLPDHFLSSCLKYSPASNTWSSISSMPGTSCLSLAAGTFGSKIYEIAGSGSDFNYIFSPSSNTWDTTTAASLPTGAWACLSLYVTTWRICLFDQAGILQIFTPSHNSWNSIYLSGIISTASQSLVTIPVNDSLVDFLFFPSSSAPSISGST